jgi:hypothetical protein
VFLTSHSGDCDVAGLCFVVVVAVLVGELVWIVHVVLLVLVPPPTIESIEKPILGLEGTATIGVGARGIIVCVCAPFWFLYFSLLFP